MFTFNKLWRAIRKAAGWVTDAVAELEELWEKLPAPLRQLVIGYAARNFGLPSFASEKEFWRWTRDQRTDVVTSLRDKSRALLIEARHTFPNGDAD